MVIMLIKKHSNIFLSKDILTTNYLIILVLVLLVGCSSSGEVKINQALTRDIDHKAVAAIEVTTSEEVDTKDESIIEVTQRLKGELFDRLVSEGVFMQVVHDKAEARYLLNVNLLSAKEVSQSSRIWWGALAGANTLAVTVQLMDLPSSEIPIMDYVVKGTSASHPLSSESGMDDAIREVIDEIILPLR